MSQSATSCPHSHLTPVSLHQGEGEYGTNKGDSSVLFKIEYTNSKPLRQF